MNEPKKCGCGACKLRGDGCWYCTYEVWYDRTNTICMAGLRFCPECGEELKA